MARAPKRAAADIPTRTVKWELKPTFAQMTLLNEISAGLGEYFNWALETEIVADESYRAAMVAVPHVKPNTKRFLNQIDLYSLWTSVRAEEEKRGLARAKIPANWVLETFVSLVGAYKSFFALVKNGDKDARPPNSREEGRFHAIPGCSSFSVREGCVVLAPTIYGMYDGLVFAVPKKYQVPRLAESIRLAKFVITRDEPDLEKEGRYWISISYEVSKPEPIPFIPEEAVYIALGASHIGVVFSGGEKVVRLGRPDYHFKPAADMVIAYRDQCTEESRSWRKRNAARQKNLRRMGRQQQLTRRKVVAETLLSYGVHFVVTDLVVRSKEGKLADASKTERGGALGANWSAQNTGTIAYLVQWLEVKAKEKGGSVRKYRLPAEHMPPDRGNDSALKKIPIAHALRHHFLKSLST